jgi:transmembrane sensor
MSETQTAEDGIVTLEEAASEMFVQRLQGVWTAEDRLRLDARLQREPEFAEAYARVEASWSELGRYAELPEIIARREKGLAFARRSHTRRWLAPQPSWRRKGALAAALIIAVVAGWQISPFGYRPGLHRTGIGEQRLVDLADHSRIALDAKTRLQVRYTKDARVVRLFEGQAQFAVAQDPVRPFRVEAGGQSIVALGTVFTVECIDKRVHVAMMEGRVAVIPQRSATGVSVAQEPPAAARASSIAKGRTIDAREYAPRAVELTTGEELRVNQQGQVTVTTHADLEAATAWREGRIIFRGERLFDAVRRLNRYSRLQVEVSDPQLAERHVSGVFEAGDTQGFVEALKHYGPIRIDYVGDTVQLRSR